MISRQLLIIDSLLVVALIWGGLKLRESQLQYEREHQPSLIQPKPETGGGTPTAGQPHAQVAEVWSDISLKNPFSVDRNDSNPVAVVVPPVVVPPKPLYFGTTVVAGERRALLGSVGSNRRYPAVKAGQVFEGWTVVEVLDRSVNVTASGVQETLLFGSSPEARSSAGGTTAQAVAPSIVISSPAAPSVGTATNTNSNSNPGLPAAPPKGTRIEQTPFGPRTVLDQ